jgi:hypothetical protein
MALQSRSLNQKKRERKKKERKERETENQEEIEKRTRACLLFFVLKRHCLCPKQLKKKNPFETHKSLPCQKTTTKQLLLEARILIPWTVHQRSSPVWESASKWRFCEV